MFGGEKQNSKLPELNLDDGDTVYALMDDGARGGESTRLLVLPNLPPAFCLSELTSHRVETVSSSFRKVFLLSNASMCL